MVVVGGGVIGLAVAWRAAAAGRAVTLVDPEPGRGASWAAAGMLAPVGEANFGEERLSALLVGAARAWPDIRRRARVGIRTSVDYRHGGHPAGGRRPVRPRWPSTTSWPTGAPSGSTRPTLSAAGCRTAEPLLAPGIRGGADLLEDHQVDNRRLVEALVVAVGEPGS